MAYSRLGLETSVNTLTVGDQLAPSVAGFAAGGFVTVWVTYDTTRDGSGSSIRMQRYDSAGAKIGSETSVNTAVVGNQTAPSVTTLANGGYVITWQTADTTQDGSGSAIKAQVFSSDGSPLGSEFRINSQLIANQSNPSITSLTTGGFVVTWETADATQDGFSSAIKGQIFGATGAAVGSEFLVNTSRNNIESISSVTSLAGGGFLATWTAGQGANADVYAQIFDANGAKSGAEFRVNTVTALNQDYSSATQISGGRFVVTWVSSATTLTYDAEIKAQLYSASGVRIGTEFTVSTTRFDPDLNIPIGVTRPNIDDLPDGGFVISWSSQQINTNTRAQFFDASGARVGGEMILNTVTNRTEGASDIAVDGNGSVFGIWTSATSSLQDYEIRGALFVNQTGPVITSNGGGESAAVSVAENQLAVTTVSTANSTGTIVYAITGGADAARFTINAATGVLTFIAARDFEVRADVGGNNIYDVVVSATNGGLVDIQALAVRIVNVNEGQTFNTPIQGAAGPEFSAGQYLVRENVTGTLATFSARDADNDVLTYSLTGADAARFVINAATGALSFAAAPNFEAPADVGGNNIYDVTIVASDGALSISRAVSFEVLNDFEAPFITSNGGGDTAAITVNENTQAVTYVTSGDPDAAPSAVTYAIAGGADAARFGIAQTGYLYFRGSPNFEAPVDADGDGIYNVIVSVSDGFLTPDTQAIAVTIANVNETPVITSNGGGDAANIAVFENTTMVASVAGNDPDGSSLSYSLAGGADAARFVINPTTGTLTFVAAPDRETPLDANADNVYEVIVRASDGTLVDTQALRVTVNNVNEAPIITSNGGGTTAVVGMAENTSNATTVTSSDPEGAPRNYTIVGGIDAARFTINSTTGQLMFVATPDFEAPGDMSGDNVYDVIVQVSDGQLIGTQQLSVVVTNTNEAPIITSNGGGDAAGLTVDENTIVVTTLGAIDVENNALSYSIAGGADSARFAIDAATGAIVFVAAPDREAPGDADGDNIYEVIVRASDGTLFDTQALTVTVNDVNEAPVITSNGGAITAAYAVAENTLIATIVSATDPENAPRAYAIIGGADAARFEIDATTGVLSFVAASDYEAPADSDGDNVYLVTVQASDGSLTATQTQAITVTPVDEAPQLAPVRAVTLAEGSTAVATVTATDPESGPLSYSITGGADAAHFVIDAESGVLRLMAAPDFEQPGDATADNVYDVIVTVSDGTTTVSQDLTVAVTNVDEAPVITSNGGGATAAVNIGENGGAVSTFAAVDPEGSGLAYAIVGGADAAQFTIDAETGSLNFVNLPDFEAPYDFDSDNIYEVIVSASDGTLVDVQALAVAVTNVNEAPMITSNGAGGTAAIVVNENTSFVTAVASTDPENTPRNYTIVGGLDAARFTIDLVSGALAFVSAPDFEAANDANGDNVYEVIVRASDGTLDDTQSVTVTVGNVNEAPVITSNGAGVTATVAVTENSSAITIVTSTDPEGTARGYAIVGGADAARFTINAVTGTLAFVALPNFEAPGDANGDNAYDVIVQASDGALFDTQALNVVVTNTNEAPVITSNGGGATAAITISENVTAVTTVFATDPEGAARTYSIIGGADAARFTINGTSGALAFLAAPNFEAPADAGSNNVYDLIVRASDGLNTVQQAIAVTIANVADGLTINGTSTANTLVGTNAEDVINGLSGNDTITGGFGADTLIGGAGADRFTYTALADSVVGSRDIIADFSRAQADRIVLSAIDANTARTGDQAFTFIGSAAFSNVAGQLRFETLSGNTFVSGDVNGDGIGDFSIQLSGNVALLASDFVL